MAVELIRASSGVLDRYRVLRSRDMEELVSEVSGLIHKGWVPLGGITSIASGTFFLHGQVLWLPEG